MASIQNQKVALLSKSNIEPTVVYLDDRKFYSLYLHLRAVLSIVNEPGLAWKNDGFMYDGLRVFRVLSDEHLAVY